MFYTSVTCRFSCQVNSRNVTLCVVFLTALSVLPCLIAKCYFWESLKEDYKNISDYAVSIDFSLCWPPRPPSRPTPSHFGETLVVMSF